MIARQNEHYTPEVLQALLDDQLSSLETLELEEHLSDCQACRNRLKKLAGEHQWWDETVDVLSERTARSIPTSAIPNDANESAVDWIAPLLDPAPDLPGDWIGKIDQFPIQGVIGQGGMGVVLRGMDMELNRAVAIKVLSPHLAGVGAARARFMREAQSAAAIVHPSVVPIYRVVTSARLPYIVMPCISGGNLQQRVDCEGPLELHEVLRIGLQVAEGLVAAHRNGVIHRDIKPANLLIEEGNGRVLISDFGLARALDDASLTVSGMIAGTPQYMSPEQARGEAIDARSDLFSFGSLLYALATGRPPFRAETPLAVLRKVTESSPRPIHEINERIPDWFNSLVRQLMEADRDHRIESAERATELIRAAHAHVLHPTANGLPVELEPSPQSGGNRNVLVAIVAVLAASIPLVMLLPQAPEPVKPKPIQNAKTSLPVPVPRAILPVNQPIDRRVEHGVLDWQDNELRSGLQQIQSQIDQLEQQIIPSAANHTSFNSTIESQGDHDE